MSKKTNKILRAATGGVWVTSKRIVCRRFQCLIFSALQQMPARASLDALLEANANGTLRGRGKARGFYSVAQKRTFPGLTPLIRRLTAPRLTKMANQLRVCATHFRGQPAVRYVGSSKRRGNAVHQALSHRMVCSASECQCLRLFGKQPAVRNGDVVRRLTSAGATWALQFELAPLASELVITSRPDQPALATRLDALFTMKRAPGELVLVSWKTARTGAFLTSKLDRKERKRHQAQLAMEAKLLAETHNVCIARCYIVYLLIDSLNRTAYVAVELELNK